MFAIYDYNPRSEGGTATMIKEKMRGTGLEMKLFSGRDGNSYLVFKTQDGSYHVFLEVQAKQAARECGATEEGNTRRMWSQIWRRA